MTQNLMVMLVDAQTGYVLEREATAQEIKDIQKSTEEASQSEIIIQNRIAARESALAKLAALGLTEAEIAAL